MQRSADDLDDLIQRAYGFALSLTHNPARAEDLVQDAWVSVLKAGGPLRRGYVFTTIRNRFIDLHRRESRLETQPLDGSEQAGDTTDPRSRSNGDSACFTDGPVGNALGRLRSEERTVLYLSAVEDYTAREIADLLEKPRGTVLSLIHRTRQKLRAMLNGKEDLLS